MDDTLEKLNCWEFKECGKGPTGSQVGESVVCPASTKSSANGINSGVNGGRTCWAIAGTMCGGRPVGLFAYKIASCMNCEFYKLVKDQEGPDFRFMD